MQRSTREEWAARVAKWKESGLSAPAFAVQIGVRPKALTWWRANLVRLAAAGPAKRGLARPREARNGNALPSVKSLEFVEMTAAIDNEWLEVVLSTSVRIRVRRGFDSQSLVRLLDVLESRR